MSANQLLPLLLSPLYLSLVLIFLGLRLRRYAVTAAGAVIVLLASLPGLVFPIYDWQQGYVRKEVSALPDCAADAIVVLAGARTITAGVSDPVTEWGDAIDRIFGGVEAWERSCASKLVFTGGGTVSPAYTSEGQAMRELAEKLGVMPAAITVLPSASNTVDEATEARRFLAPNISRILLVTSGFHMRRASMLFRNAGFEVIEYPVDLRVPPNGVGPVPWLPHMMALNRSDIMIREGLGLVYYRIKLWLETI